MTTVPYGITERCLLAIVSSWLASCIIGPILGLGCSKTLVILTLASVAAAVVYSIMTVDPKNRAILVTGCDTGFGFALAKHLHALGFVVFAGCLSKDQGGEGARKLEAEGKSTGRLITVQLNVTSDEEVQAAVRFVRSKMPNGVQGLWAVVNNAGFSTFGEMEWIPISLYEMVASINYFGVLRVTKAFLPLVREAHGRIVNVSSMMGRKAPRGRSPYCATKYAIEAISDSLRREMKKFGVDVCIIEPGNFIAGTAIYSNESVKAHSKRTWDGMSEEVRSAYTKEYFEEKTSAMLSFTTGGVSDISPVIDAMTDAVSRTYPRCRYLPMSPMDRLTVEVATHLPEIVYDTLFP